MVVGPASRCSLFFALSALVLGLLLVASSAQAGALAGQRAAALRQQQQLAEEVVSEELNDAANNYVVGLLAKMRQNLLKPLHNTKRGIDFGLGRGYSGNQAAKHFMGMVASKYASGPGKRKRAHLEAEDAAAATDEDEY